MTQTNDRAYWLETMQRIAAPVLEALHERRLKADMPVEGKTDDRSEYTHLEALGRLLTGIAPWLEAKGAGGDEEERLRERLALLARSAIDAGTDPVSPDRMNFSRGYQPIVDAAFLSQAILRAPVELWDKLEDRVRRNLIDALKATRSRKPYFNNWLLFAAAIEVALCRMGEPDWDPMRIDFALKQHEQWYVGDGTYGEGKEYHADYYNSFVIQPMLLDIVEAVGDRYGEWKAMAGPIARRAQRQAVIQERLISPEGTFPPVGRSLAYRFGAFQTLAHVALRGELPAPLEPAQVRCALTAVIRRTIEAPGTFDAGGWLTIGFCGHQPEIGETYISTGSLYLCSVAFLPLGLKEGDPFWQGEAEWTQCKAWSGASFSIDSALKGS
ncbi:DUF2264 domain-containing protein [Paenibacillus ginsengarvi]|uniref:DUF2264 domain-containing protein n=1 Tax=Paenibacillus ginsengarvi TaxID=400777 RepID=A0A3B0AS87_9BACL|nr:DUF2264 domain-containing protein [Paenibacillus ginsengarvi]RKN62086.1 DUF2264 domain-containing protein [Paenibacillus ginsengarvi]